MPKPDSVSDATLTLPSPLSPFCGSWVATNAGGKAIGVGTTKVSLESKFAMPGGPGSNFLGTFTLVVTQ
jgi:hypothetical protein